MLVRKSICCKTFQGGSWGGGVTIYIYMYRSDVSMEMYIYGHLHIYIYIYRHTHTHFFFAQVAGSSFGAAWFSVSRVEHLGF